FRGWTDLGASSCNLNKSWFSALVSRWSSTNQRVLMAKKSRVRKTAARPTAPGALDQIIRMAGASALARFAWRGRGKAPAGYVKGMALVYGRVYCKFKAGDAAVVDMARKNTGDLTHDALAWYDDVFNAAGMDNRTSGVDTLRHLFVLLT